MYAKASTPLLNSSLKRFSPGRKARQNIAGLIGAPCWTPLEQGNVMVSPESIRKNTSASRVPVALGVSAGTQLATSASTAVLFTVLKALEQSVITSQLPVSCNVRARSPTYSTPPGTATPNCLTSRLTSYNRGLHRRIAPAVMRLLHVMSTQTDRHFSPSAVRLDCRKSCQNSGGNAPGSSTSLLQKAVMPRPNSSLSLSVWMMDCGYANY